MHFEENMINSHHQSALRKIAVQTKPMVMDEILNLAMNS